MQREIKDHGSSFRDRYSDVMLLEFGVLRGPGERDHITDV